MFNRSQIMKAAWAQYRSAKTYVASNPYQLNGLYEKLEDLAQAIAPIRPTCFAGLLIKARAHQFAGNPGAIIPEIEALAQATTQEAA